MKKSRDGAAGRTWLAVVLAFFMLAGMPGAQALEALPDRITEPHFDDIDGMAKRRYVRALVYWSKTDYYIVNGRQYGYAYEMGQALEKYLNTKLKRGKRPISVIMVPVSRDKLVSYLEQGRGDIALAGLRDTAARDRIDFASPIAEQVSEVVVRYKEAPAIRSEADISGKIFHLRPSSSYFETLKQINARLQAQGKASARVEYLNENLADSDIMEMMNAGLINYTILDDFRGRLWDKQFPGVQQDSDFPLLKDQSISFGLRKNTPKFKALVDGFMKGHRKGTQLGNVLTQRYYGSDRNMKNVLSPAEMQRFRSMVVIFKKYAVQYDFDYLLLTAQGYQESGLNQKQRSHVGAIGVMQVMPATGKAMKVGNIYQLNPNIHAGTKYMHHLATTYFNEPELDSFNRTLLCFAAYNAGPTRMSALRKQAKARGLNPNIWFDNVERVVAEKVGRETVQYVTNISKYYVAYKLVEEQEASRLDAKSALDAAAKKSATP
ncbi:MAG: transglycosylase SLT domain-containing protein [Moraxellaceae bacterium]